MANHNPIPPSPETPRLSLVVTEESPEYDAAPKHEAGFAIMPARVLAIKDGYVRGVYSELAKYANAEGRRLPGSVLSSRGSASVRIDGFGGFTLLRLRRGMVTPSSGGRTCGRR